MHLLDAALQTLQRRTICFRDQSALCRGSMRKGGKLLLAALIIWAFPSVLFLAALVALPHPLLSLPQFRADLRIPARALLTRHPGRWLQSDCGGFWRRIDAVTLL